MEKYDLFISTLDITPNRIKWSRETIVNYSKHPNLRITIIDAGSCPEQLEWFKENNLFVVPQPYEGSTYRRFLIAEAYARTDPFLFSDNDIIPIESDWLVEGLETMRRHPRFGWLCYRLERTDFSYDNGFKDNEVWSVHYGGGLAIIRRDARQIPFTVPAVFNENRADDRTYVDAIKRSGWDAGLLLKLHVKHIGNNESSSWGRSDHFFKDK